MVHRQLNGSARCFPRSLRVERADGNPICSHVYRRKTIAVSLSLKDDLNYTLLEKWKLYLESHEGFPLWKQKMWRVVTKHCPKRYSTESGSFWPNINENGPSFGYCRTSTLRSTPRSPYHLNRRTTQSAAEQIALRRRATSRYYSTSRKKCTNNRQRIAGGTYELSLTLRTLSQEYHVRTLQPVTSGVHEHGQLQLKSWSTCFAGIDKPQAYFFGAKNLFHSLS